MNVHACVDYHFNNLRFNKSQHTSDFPAARVVISFVSSDILNFRLLNLLADHPMRRQPGMALRVVPVSVTISIYAPSLAHQLFVLFRCWFTSHLMIDLQCSIRIRINTSIDTGISISISIQHQDLSLPLA